MQIQYSYCQNSKTKGFGESLLQYQLLAVLKTMYIFPFLLVFFILEWDACGTIRWTLIMLQKLKLLSVLCLCLLLKLYSCGLGYCAFVNRLIQLNSVTLLQVYSYAGGNGSVARQINQKVCLWRATVCSRNRCRHPDFKYIPAIHVILLVVYNDNHA